MRTKKAWKWLAVMLAGLLLLTGCGGDDDPEEGPAPETEASTDPTAEGTATEGGGEEVTLSFLWFEWPPAQLLEDFANEHYKQVNPNVTFEVNAVPNTQWHDAIFTGFAAQDTAIDIPVLDSQWLGEATEGGHILDMSEFAKERLDLTAYAPNLLAAYAQYPQTGEFDPEGPIYGLPLLADTWVMMYRKDLVGEEPPATWEEMLEKAQECQDENDGMSGLAFHGNNGYDVAGITLNTVIWINGGEIWDPETRQIEGVINNEAGQQAMDQLVNTMVPLAPEGVGTAFISEVNAAMSQGTACIGLNWVAGLEGIQDPANSTLGTTEEEILEKIGFAPLPPGEENVKPLGGMGMHVSSYSEHQQEALDFIEWFQQPEVQTQWAAAGGVPARIDALESEEFLSARPWNAAFTESVPFLRDFWALPEFFRLIDIHSSNANAAITGVKTPEQALNDLAAEEQAILDGDV